MSPHKVNTVRPNNSLKSNIDSFYYSNQEIHFVRFFFFFYLIMNTLDESYKKRTSSNTLILKGINIKKVINTKIFIKILILAYTLILFLSKISSFQEM